MMARPSTWRTFPWWFADQHTRHDVPTGDEGRRIYRYSDVQQASWHLIEDNQSADGTTYSTYAVQDVVPTVTPGEPAGKVKGPAIRYRSFGNTSADEVHLGRAA